MNKTILAVALATTVATATAQSTLELPEFVKDQTGIYQVRYDFLTNGARIADSTGVAIEVFNPGERVLVDGTRLDHKFVFGALYLPDGTFRTFSGPVRGNPVVVDLFETHGNGTTNDVGDGLLEVDPQRVGWGDVISFEFVVDDPTVTSEGEPEPEPKAPRTLRGTFERASDAPVFGCLDTTSRQLAVCATFAHS